MLLAAPDDLRRHPRLLASRTSCAGPPGRCRGARAGTVLGAGAARRREGGVAIRPFAVGALALAALLALTGCDARPTVNAGVLPIPQARSRYLDAMCPLLAEPAFWGAEPLGDLAGARGTATRILPSAERSADLLGDPPRPWPLQLRGDVATVSAAVRADVGRLQAVERADDASALAAVPAAAPVPQDALDGIEALLTVSAAAGSPNCPGHGLPSASPTPTGQ